MPNFKKNTSSAMYKKAPFKMKSSPTKLFGLGKSARQKRARRYELEDRKEKEIQMRDNATVGYNQNSGHFNL